MKVWQHILYKLILLAAIFIYNISNAFAVIRDSEEAAAFANFISELIATTQTQTQNDGAVCTFGSDEISKVIAIQNQEYINLDSDPKSFNLCKAIYVAQGMQKGLGVEVKKFTNNKIMTISVFEGFVESGGMVQVQMGRRNFEIILNSKEVRSSNVRLNAIMLSLVIN